MLDVKFSTETKLMLGLPGGSVIGLVMFSIQKKEVSGWDQEH